MNLTFRLEKRGDTEREHTLAEVVAFLNGSAPLEGVWFGDKHPERRGMFWWRSLLNAALAQRTEQEPVATVIDPPMCRDTLTSWAIDKNLPTGTKLYARPVLDDEGYNRKTNDLIERHAKQLERLTPTAEDKELARQALRLNGLRFNDDVVYLFNRYVLQERQ